MSGSDTNRRTHYRNNYIPRRFVENRQGKRPALLPTPQSAPTAKQPRTEEPHTHKKTTVTVANYFAEERRFSAITNIQDTVIVKICLTCTLAVAAGKDKTVRNWDKYSPFFEQVSIDLNSEDQAKQYECRICDQKLFPHTSAVTTRHRTPTTVSSESSSDSE